MDDIVKQYFSDAQLTDLASDVHTRREGHRRVQTRWFVLIARVEATIDA